LNIRLRVAGYQQKANTHQGWPIENLAREDKIKT